MFYLYKKTIFNHGWNDGDEITDTLTLLLALSRSKDEIQYLKGSFQFEFYKQLYKYKVISESEKSRVIQILGNEVSESHWTKKLNELTYNEFERLEAEFGFDFLKIVECEPDKEKFYPLFNHMEFGQMGLDSKYYHDHDYLTQLLTSSNKQEAFEKGILFLLLTNDVSSFIGDPETTQYSADFQEYYYNHTKNLLDYFSKQKAGLFNKGIPKGLISKHGVLKFWILKNAYHMDKNKFNSLLQYKSELLEDKLDHFNKLVELFQKKGSELIQIVNVC